MSGSGFKVHGFNPWPRPVSLLDSRLRGNDELRQVAVIPAKLVLDSDRGAGIQKVGWQRIYRYLLRTYNQGDKELSNDLTI